MTKEHGLGGSLYGPPYSGDAMDAAEDACAAADEGRMGAKVALDAAHDPALGLDGSICKRAVIDWLRQQYREALSEDAQTNPRLDHLADELETEWSDAR